LTETSPHTTAAPRRRGLLAALGGAAAAAAPAAAALASPAEPHRADALPPGMAPRKEGEEEKRKPRYRETDHVRAFYQTNRY
jgi:hypothetical protein